MRKLGKTDQIVSYMKRLHGPAAIADIRQATGFPTHIIGGLLASLERQERVAKTMVDGACRNHWILVNADRRMHTHGVVYTPGRDSCRRNQPNINIQAGVELQNIMFMMVRSSRAHSMHAY
jgi:very-short-patch-repair endonuclease